MDSVVEYLALGEKFKSLSFALILSFTNKFIASPVDNVPIVCRTERRLRYTDSGVISDDLMTCLNFLIDDIRSFIKFIGPYINGLLNRRQLGQMRQ